MIFEIYLPDNTPKEKREVLHFKKFLQAMANRIAVGSFRYGDTTVFANYFSRMQLEIKAYKKTGNIEHLYNIANYAWLECIAPENQKSNHDSLVDSVTRKRFGKNE